MDYSNMDAKQLKASVNSAKKSDKKMTKYVQ